MTWHESSGCISSRKFWFLPIWSIMIQLWRGLQIGGVVGKIKGGDCECAWVKKITICVVCDYLQCQNRLTTSFTFYASFSSSLQALTTTSQARIIELTTLCNHKPPPPLSRCPVTSWGDAGSWFDSFLHLCDLHRRGCFVLATLATNL